MGQNKKKKNPSLRLNFTYDLRNNVNPPFPGWKRKGQQDVLQSSPSVRRRKEEMKRFSGAAPQSHITQRGRETQI